MARHRTRVRASRSLRAVAVGLLAAVTATALFEFDIERALLSRYRARGDWPPTYSVWHDDVVLGADGQVPQ